MTQHLVRSLIHVYVVNRRRGETFLTSDAQIFVSERLTRSGNDDVSKLVIEALVNDEDVEAIEHEKKGGAPSRWVRV